MTRASFNKDWTVRPRVGAYAAMMGASRPPQAVTLPHDAMIRLERSARNGTGSGYFDAETQKTFDGRALAIIRPTTTGAIEVTASAEGCADVTLTIEARDVAAAKRLVVA